MLSKRSIATAVVSTDDQVLVQRYIDGDESAFEALLHRHKRKVWSHIYLLVRDRELTEDLFQEVFIKVVNTLKSRKYNEEGKFLPSVMRIAHNLVIDQFRRNKKMALVRSKDDHDVFAAMQQPGKNAEQSLVNVQIDADIGEEIEDIFRRVKPTVEIQIWPIQLKL